MESAHQSENPHVLRDHVLRADRWRGAMLNLEGEVRWPCRPTWSYPAVFAGLLGPGDSDRGSSGLFSEDFDVAQRGLRGNIPRAFVHALLIEAAAKVASV
jgi:hypothetical protein